MVLSVMSKAFCIVRRFCPLLSNGVRITDRLIKKYSRRATFGNVQSAAPQSREIRSMYPSLHRELFLSMRRKQANVDSRTGLFVVLQIYATSLTQGCTTQWWHLFASCI